LSNQDNGSGEHCIINVVDESEGSDDNGGDYIDINNRKDNVGSDNNNNNDDDDDDDDDDGNDKDDEIIDLCNVEFGDKDDNTAIYHYNVKKRQYETLREDHRGNSISLLKPLSPHTITTAATIPALPPKKTTITTTTTTESRKPKRINRQQNISSVNRDVDIVVPTKKYKRKSSKIAAKTTTTTATTDVATTPATNATAKSKRQNLPAAHAQLSVRRTVIAFDIGIKTLSWIIMSVDAIDLKRVEIFEWKTIDILEYLACVSSGLDGGNKVVATHHPNNNHNNSNNNTTTKRINANKISSTELTECCVGVMYAHIIPAMIKYRVEKFILEMQPHLLAQSSRKMHTITYALSAIYNTWLFQERIRIHQIRNGTLCVIPSEPLDTCAPETISESAAATATTSDLTTTTGTIRNSVQNQIKTTSSSSNSEIGNNKGDTFHIPMNIVSSDEIDFLLRGAEIIIQNANNKLMKFNAPGGNAVDGNDDDDSDNDIENTFDAFDVFDELNGDDVGNGNGDGNDDGDDDDNNGGRQQQHRQQQQKGRINTKKSNRVERNANRSSTLSVIKKNNYNKKKDQSVAGCQLMLFHIFPPLSKWLVAYDSWKNKRDRADAFWHAMYYLFYKDSVYSNKSIQREMEHVLGIGGAVRSSRVKKRKKK
jgi:hypothetical protein